MQYSCVNDTSEDMTAIKKRFHRGQKNCTREKIGKKEKVNSIEIDIVLIFIIYY